MSEKRTLIDTGASTVGIAFDMGKLKAGETKSFHITGEHLLAGAPCMDHDLLNAKSIQMKVQGPVRCGVTLHHDAKCMKPIATGSRVIHVDARTGEANAYHHISGAMTDLHLHDASDASAGEHVIKRCQPKWQGMNLENIKSGVFEVTKQAADGTTAKKYVVTPTASEMLRNTNNAIHTLINANESNSRFFGGKFAKTANKISFNGHENCYVLTGEEHNQLKSQLSTALSKESAFSDGLCCTVTNLDRHSGDKPTVVQCQITRHPGTAAKVEGGAITEKFEEPQAAASSETGAKIFGKAAETDKFEVNPVE